MSRPLYQFVVLAFMIAFLFFFPLDSASAGFFAFLLVFLFLVSRFVVFRVSSYPVVAFAVLLFFFLYSRNFVLPAVFVLFACSLFLPLARGFARFANPGLLLFFVFLFSLFLNSVTLDNSFVADFGWHLLFAESFVDSFPHVPHVVPLMRGGMPFYYPPFSYLLLALMKFVFPGLRLFFLGKLLMVLFASFLVFPVYLLARQMSGSGAAGVLAAFLFAASPFKLLFYQFSSTVALPFLLFSVYFALRSFESGCRRDSFLAGFFLLFGFLNHVLPSLVVGFFILVLSAWRSFSVRKVHFSFVVVFCCMLFFGLAYLTWLYLLSGFRPWDILDRRVVLLANPVSQDVILFEQFLRDFPTLVAIGAVGVLRCFRDVKKWFPLYLFIFLTLLWVMPPYIGIYLFSGSDRFVIFLIISLSIFGGAFLGRSVFLRREGKIFSVFLLLVLFAPNVASSVNQLGHTALSSDEDLAFGWIRENLEEDAVIITDNGHAFWMPYVAKRTVINGHQNDMASGDRRDLDAALIFSGVNVSDKVSLMHAYASRYVYFSNSTLHPFPYLTYEDVVSPVPSVGAWANVSAGLGVFEHPPFRRIFFRSGTDTIAIYELNQ